MELTRILVIEEHTLRDGIFPVVVAGSDLELSTFGDLQNAWGDALFSWLSDESNCSRLSFAQILPTEDIAT